MAADLSWLHGGIDLMTRLILDATPPEQPVATALDVNQQAVVEHTRGALRVLAGPGTGKTTTLVEAMAARLVGEQALKPNQVLGLTFGRRAALDWRDRVTAQIGGGEVPLISTFHSFCYALVRMYEPSERYVNPIRLLSGPEQEARSRQLFNNSINDGRLTWPTELMPAVGTRGLAEEVREVMSRTRSHLMDPAQLVSLGKQSANETWQAIGKFMDEYLDVLDSEGVLDYSELIYRAVLLCNQPEVAKDLHQQFKAIFVDEYQDTDPGQVELLKAMIGPETSLVVVGDIDQAIYGFRGADESGLRKFDEVFAPLFNGDIKDEVLTNCRRFGPTIRAAATAVIEKQFPIGIDPELIREHRNPTVSAINKDELLVRTYDSEGAEASNIADLVARAHAHEGYAWSDIAVIVRSARVSMPAIQRALISAGVPVTVAADEVPLHLDPAVMPLLDLLRVIDEPSALSPEVAMDLLAGPLANVDQIDLRRLTAYLRKTERINGNSPKPSTVLIAQVIAEPGLLSQVPRGAFDSIVSTVTRLGNLISSARSLISKGATPHEVLDFIWQESDWRIQLEDRSLSFDFSSQNANRDLDSICALFDLANRFVIRGGGKDLTIFLAEIESQAIPAEPLAENDIRSDSVRLLTAHRAKGLQWPMVIVAGAQENLWPDLRSHQTILQADRIGKNEILMPPTFAETLAGERRLFYVAVTRAMQKLVLTAVDTSINDDGVQPSRFLRDIQAKLTDLDWQHIGGRPKRPLNVDGLVSSLRRVLMDANSSPELKTAAASRLAKIGKKDSPVFKNALPENWWGINEITKNEKAKNNSVALSATAIENIELCSLRWFLERKVGAISDSSTKMIFGNILHLIAAGLQNSEIPTDLDFINTKIDQVWPELGYEASWESTRERQEARDASVRLLNWFIEHNENESLAETQLALTKSISDEFGNDYQVNITGFADRVEFTVDGVMIYDFKTSKKIVKKSELAQNVQLALYSYLFENGNYKVGEEVRKLEEDQFVQGAALIQLRNGTADLPEIQLLKAGDHDESSDRSIETRISEAAFVAANEIYETKYDEQTCKFCAVRTLCPATTEGRQVQL